MQLQKSKSFWKYNLNILSTNQSLCCVEEKFPVYLLVVIGVVYITWPMVAFCHTPSIRPFTNDQQMIEILSISYLCLSEQ